MPVGANDQEVGMQLRYVAQELRRRRAGCLADQADLGLYAVPCELPRKMLERLARGAALLPHREQHDAPRLLEEGHGGPERPGRLGGLLPGDDDGAGEALGRVITGNDHRAATTRQQLLDQTTRKVVAIALPSEYDQIAVPRMR